MEQAVFTKVAILVLCVILFSLLMGYTSEFRKLLDRSKQQHAARDAQLTNELKTGLAASFVILSKQGGAFNGIKLR